jgi:hypothetical protein
MVEIHACKTPQNIIGKFRMLAASSRIKTGFALILAEWIFCMIAFGQQSQKEYIYMGGKAIATETFNQANGCSSTISPASVSISTAGGTGNVSITSPSGCSWSASSNAPSWIHISSGSSGSGNGTMSYSVDANAGPVRSGTITITGQAFTVNQAGSCATYTLNPESASYTFMGYTGSTFTVTAGSGCSWTATSNSPWITITEGSSGTGNGTVTYTVAPNADPARNGTISIGNSLHYVSQDAIPSCDQNCVNSCMEGGAPWYFCMAMCGCQ